MLYAGGTKILTKPYDLIKKIKEDATDDKKTKNGHILTIITVYSSVLTMRYAGYAEVSIHFKIFKLSFLFKIANIRTSKKNVNLSESVKIVPYFLMDVTCR